MFCLLWSSACSGREWNVLYQGTPSTVPQESHAVQGFSPWFFSQTPSADDYKHKQIADP
jgi:hypothetical protein